MPGPFALAIPALATIGAVAGGVGVWGQILVYTVTTAAAWSVQPSVQPKIPRGLEMQDNTCELDAHLPLVYGQVRMSGNDVFYFTEGNKNKYLWIVEVYGEGEFEGIVQDGGNDLIFINDKPLSEFTGLVDYWFHAGTTTQTYDTNLNTATSDWTDNMRRTAYMVWKFTYDSAHFSSIPRRSTVLQGRKIWLPDNTKAYSANVAAVLYDFLKTPHCAVGLGWPEEDMLSSDEIDYYSYKAAYDHCATKGWEYNGIVLSNEEVRDTIDRLKKHFRGNLKWNDGMFYFKYKDLNDESVEMALTDDHIARGEDGKAMIGISQPGPESTMDGMRVTFVNITDNKYFQDSTIIGEQEGVIRNFDLPGFISKEKAGALGTYYIERNKDPYNRIISGTFRDDCAQLEKSDVITLTCAALGYSAQYMRVVSVAILPTGFVQLDLQLEHTDLYNDTYDVATDATYSCTLPDVANFDPVTDPEKYNELADQDHVFTLADLNKVHILDSNNDRTITLPSVGDDELGYWVKFIHYGTGKLTIQAADNDYIDESAAGGKIWHEVWA